MKIEPAVREKAPANLTPGAGCVLVGLIFGDIGCSLSAMMTRMMTAAIEPAS